MSVKSLSTGSWYRLPAGCVTLLVVLVSTGGAQPPVKTRKIAGTPGMLYTPHLSPDGNLVAASTVKVRKMDGKVVGAGNELRVWEVKTGKDVTTMSVDTDTPLGFTSDGGVLVVVKYRGAATAGVGYRDPTTGAEVEGRKPVEDGTNVSFSGDRKKLILVGRPNKEDKHPVEIRDAKTDKALSTLTLPKAESIRARLSADGKTLTTLSETRGGPSSLATWDVATGKRRAGKEVAGLSRPILSADGRWVFGQAQFQHGALLDSSGKVRMTLPTVVNHYRFSGNGRWLICWTSTNQIAFIDLKALKVTRSFKPPFPDVSGFDLTADGKSLVVSGRTAEGAHELHLIPVGLGVK
jgi:hypothetical protein